MSRRTIIFFILPLHSLSISNPDIVSVCPKVVNCVVCELVPDDLEGVLFLMQ